MSQEERDKILSSWPKPNIDIEKVQAQIRIGIQNLAKQLDIGTVAVPTATEPIQSDVAPPKRKRGRRPDTDANQDRRIYEAWKSGTHSKFADLAIVLGRSEREVRLDVDRHEKRLRRGTK